MKTVMLALSTYDSRELALDYTEVSAIEEIRGGSRIGMKNGQMFEVTQRPDQIRKSIMHAYEEQKKLDDPHRLVEEQK